MNRDLHQSVLNTVQSSSKNKQLNFFKIKFCGINIINKICRILISVIFVFKITKHSILKNLCNL